MIKRKYLMIFICSIFLLSFVVMKAEGDEYAKNIEITESDIKIDHQEFPTVAYLFLTLKNNGDRKVSNATFEISYYGKEGYLIKKAILIILAGNMSLRLLWRPLRNSSRRI